MPIRSDFKYESDWLEHLRLYFAGQALAGMLSGDRAWSNLGNPIHEWARHAFEHASAMLSLIPRSAIPSENGSKDEEEEGGD